MADEGATNSNKRTCCCSNRLSPKSPPSGRQNVPDTLLDVAARVVAANVSFQRVEETCSPLPEPVLGRIVFWSFPRSEDHIRMYSSFVTGLKCGEDGEPVQLPFDRGVKLLESGAVEDVLQIGFHLSGTVRESSSDALYSEPEKRFRVSVNFDRCKITSVKCGCELKDIFWCQHVVALALYRIRKADSVLIRMPISETLQQMTREQLQKLAQYLIAAHHTEVLPTAQRLADDILNDAESDINSLPGAPDPTAGGSLDDDNSWHLDEEQVQKLVKTYLSQGIYCNHNEHLSSIFDKVREMLRARDNNSVRMLKLITEQFLTDSRLSLWRTQGIPVTDKCRQLWDEIGVLWVCVVLKPNSSAIERSAWVRKLKTWSELPVCPLEDGYTRPTNGPGNSDHVAEPPRTVFHRALEAVTLTWTDSHLRSILYNDSPQSTCHSCHSNHGSNVHRHGNEGSIAHHTCTHHDMSGRRVWTENIPVACARVEALRCHGFVSEARRLAIAVARGVKFQQLRRLYHGRPATSSTSYCSLSSTYSLSHRRDLSSSHISGGFGSRSLSVSSESWVGHPMDPIGCLFSTLLEASNKTSAEEAVAELHSLSSVASSNCYPSSSSSCSSTNRPWPSCSSESYLSLAIEIALVGLSQHRLMPPGDYAQEKALKQEEKLIGQLEHLELNNDLIKVLRDQVLLLLDGGSASGLSMRIHTESVPMHTFAKFLFNSLLAYDSDLAFRVGLRAMRLPVIDDRHDIAAAADNVDAIVGQGGAGPAAAPVFSHYPRWFTISHIESRQCDLAATMLYAARDDTVRLRAVLESAQRNIYSSRQLFKLAQDAYKRAIPPVNSAAVRCRPLLDAALELGLQVVRVTLSRPSWHRSEMVQWLVSCATELGYEALISLMKNWYNLFTPAEATTAVAMTIISPATLVHLDLDFVRQDELAQCARTLAVQCVTKDAASCALGSLALCESSAAAFDRAYHIVATAAATGAMTPTQLFAIARYLERRAHPRRAHRAALLAMRGLSVAAGQDSHPALADVRWACSLARSVGADELASMLAALIENVHCATVLSDVLRRCAAPGEGKAGSTPLSYDRPPLAALLSAALAAYVSAAHARLAHISPRHYADFIEFLVQARDTFRLAADGPVRFAQLIDNMKLVYKGKKKLMLLITERFGP